METARQGESFPWLERVQVNLPLRGLFGSYGRLAVEWPINPEVGIDAKALDTLRPKHLRFAKEMLEGRRITAHLPFLDLAPGATDPLAAEVVRKRLEKAAIWAVELGATQAVAHLSYNSRIRRDPERYLGHLVENMGPAARVLKEAGAGLALENTIEHEPTILVLARDAMAQAGGGRVGFCLDTGHALAFTNTSLEDWWRAMAPHLIEIHLHDNNGLFDDHLPPGQGKLDWDFIRKRFDQLDPKPVLTLEPHRETHFWASLRGLETVWR
jgi:sugar phosphate isomerase/epimerase